MPSNSGRSASSYQSASGRARTAARRVSERVAGRLPEGGVSVVADGVTDAIGNVVAMLRGISTDPRVPQSAKLEATAALAYLVSGRGRIPGFIPLVGRIDRLAVAAFALRRLLISAGEPVLRSHWRGGDRSLEALLAFTAALASPGGRIRRMAVAGTAASLLRDRLTAAPTARAGRTARGATDGYAGRRRRPGAGRVVDGEVLSRRDTAR